MTGGDNLNKIDSWLNDENIQKVKNLYELGKTKKDIAKEMGITVNTLNKWCKNYNAFAEIFNNDACTKSKRQNLSNNITQKRNKNTQFNVEKYMISAMKKLEKKMKSGDIASAVEYSLLKRALGYNYSEERTEYTEKTGEKTVITRKHAPPDTTAQMIWLKNHKPEIWNDKKNNPNSENLFEIKISLINPDCDDNGN